MTSRILKTQFLNYTNILKSVLASFEHALLIPSMDRFSMPIQKVALRSKDREPFLQELSDVLEFEIIQSKHDSTILTTTLSDNQLITVELYHFFYSGRLIYLDIETLFEHCGTQNYAQNIPKWEHLLEFNIFNSFLNEQGLENFFIRQFEGLHIFLQEGLLDFFNTKYNTQLSSLDELSEYKEPFENHLRKQLKQLPGNKFSNRIKLDWLNTKNLLRRSAIFSFLH